MKIDIALGADVAALISELVASGRDALASLPPLPAVADLLSFEPNGDFFAGDVTVTISAAPALKGWCDEVKTRLGAFAHAAQASET